MADENVLNWFKKYHRLTNYLGASMLYLKDNYFLEEDLKPEHIKNRILGHWGTVPGLNFMYAGLNYLIKKTNQEMNECLDDDDCNCYFGNPNDTSSIIQKIK